MAERCDCPFREMPDAGDACFHCGRPLLAYDDWAALMVTRFVEGQRALAEVGS